MVIRRFSAGRAWLLPGTRLFHLVLTISWTFTAGFMSVWVSNIILPLTWQCWRVWGQSFLLCPLQPVSPPSLQGWRPRSRGAALQRWHTGRTWPFWRVRRHISAPKNIRQNKCVNIFSLTRSLSEDVRRRWEEKESQRTRRREVKRERVGGRETGREGRREPGKPDLRDALTQADKWFICFLAFSPHSLSIQPELHFVWITKSVSLRGASSSVRKSEFFTKEKRKKYKKENWGGKKTPQ